MLWFQIAHDHMVAFLATKGRAQSLGLTKEQQGSQRKEGRRLKRRAMGPMFTSKRRNLKQGGLKPPSPSPPKPRYKPTLISITQHLQPIEHSRAGLNETVRRVVIGHGGTAVLLRNCCPNRLATLAVGPVLSCPTMDICRRWLQPIDLARGT